VTVALD
jgi:hypothetical protein